MLMVESNFKLFLENSKFVFRKLICKSLSEGIGIMPQTEKRVRVLWQLIDSPMLICADSIHAEITAEFPIWWLKNHPGSPSIYINSYVIACQVVCA